MRRAAKFLAIAAALYLGLMLVSGLVIKSSLSDKTLELVSSVRGKLPVDIAISGGDFDLFGWVLLRPAVTLRDLSVGNPPGFSSEPMIRAREVSARVPLLSLLFGDLRVNRVAIREPALRLETNTEGKQNLSALWSTSSAPASRGAPAEAGGTPGLAVDELDLEGGSLAYADPEGAYDFLRVNGFNLRLTNFSTDSRFNIVAEGRLFGGEQSRFHFAGKGGPLGPSSVPAAGQLSVVVAAAEIPREFRVRQFGNLLRDPGEKSRLALAARVSGDLAGVLKGSGRLRLENFELGKDAGHRIGLNGEVPLQLVLKNALGAPAVDLAIEKAGFGLGAGRLEASVKLGLAATMTRGQIAGSIQDVEINQMLSAFTSSSDRIFGTAAAPDFTLRFAGRNSQELLDSLTGRGAVTLERGRVALLDTFGAVLQTAGKMLKLTGLSGSTSPAGAGSGQTEFTTLKANFRIGNRQVELSGIALESPVGEITGSGRFGFDEQMNFNLVAHVGGPAAAALGAKAGASGKPRVAVPFRITGTLARPKVTPDVHKLAGSAAAQVVEGLMGGEKPAGGALEGILGIFNKNKGKQ